MRVNFIDIAGRKFGRLVVVSYYGGPRQSWICRCDCGTDTIVRGDSLKSGRTQSCGCLSAQSTTDRQTTHKMTKTPEYVAWQNAKDRCSNPNSKMWPRYGGRGIAMCTEWVADFSAFLSYIGRRPSSKYSLDRYPNNDGNYEPGNVRWATENQQKRNTSNNRVIIVCGEKLCVIEAAERYGVPYRRLSYRLDCGWTPERALGLRS